MRSFILVLLAVILIKPCLAQTMSEGFGSNAFAMNQFYNSLNGSFDDVSEILAEQAQIKVMPILQEKAHLLAGQALIDGQSYWGLEKAGFDFEKTAYAFPVQMKIISINEEQAQLLLKSIREAQTVLGKSQAYSDSRLQVAMAGHNIQNRNDSFWNSLKAKGIVIDSFSNQFDKTNPSKMLMYVGPGNGGGGVFYQAGIMGFQDYFRDQSQKAIKLVDRLQGIEVNPYSSELTYWKATASNNQIEEFLSAVYRAGNSTSQPAIIYAEEIAKAQYGNGWHFIEDGLPVQFVDDNALAYYGANMEELIKQVMEENQAGSVNEFYQTDDYFQNGTVFVVGPGNGGGGTYIK
ncbi:MAG: hypothetical protein OXJ52_01870 [Oligoflexia bacterium]|nr:hypothetical protein [Oligoflexia bacterium]